MYAIKHKPKNKYLGFVNKYLGFVNRHYVFEFELSEWLLGNVWVTNSKEIAKTARDFHPEWYNADFDTPINPFNSEDLEIVELKEA